MEKTQENSIVKSKRFIIGVILIIVSIAYGWIGLFLCSALALRHGVFWAVLGWIIYGMSWITFLLGFVLAGSSGIQYAKIYLKGFLDAQNKRLFLL